MGDVTPLTDAERDALVDAAGKARGGLPCFNPAWPEFLTLANPAAILSWSARDTAQMRRIAELEQRQMIGDLHANAISETRGILLAAGVPLSTFLDDHVAALVAERDTLRAQLAAARESALREAAAVLPVGPRWGSPEEHRAAILSLIPTKGPTDAE